MRTTPRYDGLADWYDETVRAGPAGEITRLAVATAGHLLGPGTGRCLDVACGTGVAVSALTELGWELVGLDISPDQLRVARRHLGPDIELVQGDAAAMPFPDASFDAAVFLLAHTDVDGIGGVFSEISRVLAPGSRFVFVGAHPCFVNPSFERRVTPPHLLHEGYRQTERVFSAPGFGTGLRPRVGVAHVPLADLLNAMLDAGLRLEHAEEPGPEDVPSLVAFSAVRNS